MDAVNNKLYPPGVLGISLAPTHKDILRNKFTMPPFSVLNAREGHWQERKRAWLSLGIRSEVGREELVLYGEDVADLTYYKRKAEAEKNNRRLAPGGHSGKESSAYFRGKKDSSPGGSPRPAMDYSKKERGRGDGKAIQAYQIGSWMEKNGEASRAGVRSSDEPTSSAAYQEGVNTGTSIFDPVLCELMYKWFCPAGGTILDPFAGGSVRGVVASILGMQYIGIDLRQVQINANEEQARAICDGLIAPRWHCGDSIEVLPILEDARADMLFSCPPYGNLEQYSNDPKDLSNMTLDGFLGAYQKIITASYARLKNNRFAAFVVGDYRGKDGNFCNFVSETIKCFLEAGFKLYNEMILVTAVGSLPIRVTSQFENSRKIGKTHQNVLVFIKGDAKMAATRIKAGSDIVNSVRLIPIEDMISPADYEKYKRGWCELFDYYCNWPSYQQRVENGDCEE